MRRAGWVKVTAKIVECFRAFEEPVGSAHPWYEIVADIKTPGVELEGVAARQKLSGFRFRWRAPDPGEVVSARWDPAHRELRLDLRGDPRYDERLIRALGRTRRAVPPSGPTGGVG
jgi:hypothetical protein